MILSIEECRFATALNLNMDYYYIKVDADAQKLGITVFPWGEYKHKRLSKCHVKTHPRYGIL
jgi:hypothetical protein